MALLAQSGGDVKPVALVGPVHGIEEAQLGRREPPTQLLPLASADTPEDMPSSLAHLR
jgi:hypothetical protein